MTARPDGAWAEAVRTECAGLVGPPSLDGTVQVDVTGGGDGDLAVHAVFESGRMVGAGPGAATRPDVTLSLSARDARAVVAGELGPSVAFMQGRLKVVGDMGLVLDLLALSATGDADAARSRLAALAST